MLGHELRNPLAPIVTALDLIEMRGGPVADNEHQVIRRHVDHLMRLVDDLLDVTRITRGKIELRSERVELAEQRHDLGRIFVPVHRVAEIERNSHFGNSDVIQQTERLRPGVDKTSPTGFTRLVFHKERDLRQI